MRTFVIADSSKRRAKPIGVLLWEADLQGGPGRFQLEVATWTSQEALPLSVSFCARRPDRRATKQESIDWVRSRIVPETRHNIAEVLLANGLTDYDEVSLLAACQARSSDDDLLAYEVELPEGFVDGPKGASNRRAQASRADRIIDAVERRRSAAGVSYAFVALPQAPGADPGAAAEGTATQPTAAQRIGASIRALRREQGLTQKQLAARAGITQTVISRTESGAGNPTLSLLEEIAAALGTNLSVELECDSCEKS